MTIEMVTVGGVGFSLRRKLLGTVRVRTEKRRHAV
jgi:Fe2+ transport system protein FeoA